MANGPSTRLGEADIRPIHPIFVPVAASFLLGAFITDLIYLKAVTVQWETFSIWLLTAGLIMTGIAFVALLVDLLGRGGGLRPAWAPLVAAVVAGVLSLFNAFIHSRDGYTAVVPQGLILSTVVAVLLVFMGWNRWTLSMSPRSMRS